MPVSPDYRWALPAPQTNVVSYLGAAASASNKPLWIDSIQPAKSLSAAQALHWAARLAVGLESLGLARGDVVFVCSPNHIFVPVAFLAIAGAGFVFTGASPASTADELAYQLSDSAPSAVLAHPRALGPVLEAAARVGIPKSRIIRFSDADEPGPGDHGADDWRAIVASADRASHWLWPTLRPSEAAGTVAAINYSSGTTGLPKGVCVSHANLIASAEQIAFMLYAGTPYPFAGPSSPPLQRPEERWIGFLPLYHGFGELFLILAAARLGVSVYLMAEFAFKPFLAAIQRYRITHLHLVPVVLAMLYKQPETDQADLSSVGDVVCGAAPLSRQLQDDCQARFKFRIRQAWGLTEATCLCTMEPGDSDDGSGSVGKLAPNIQAKLLDDDGREAPPGTPGELYIKGPNISLGYWRNDRATREAIDGDGWLRTGDIATCSHDGVFNIVDRKKELIKVNALQVAPAELEAALLKNEHVAHASVVGITFDGNEWPRAYVVVQDASRAAVTPGDIKAWVASRVARHKRLEGGVVFVNEIPRLASGKIKRSVVKEWARRDAAELQSVGGAAAKPRL